MTTQTSLRKAFLLSGVAIFAVTCGRAALAEADVSKPPEEVIVTANKQAERIHDVAQAVTAVTGSDMAIRQESDFRDFSAQVPGFHVEEDSAVFQREIIRGQNSGGAGATVATMVDGMPLSFSGSDSNAALTSTNVDTYDMQRIEVLKGPQGTLYGATAEGGVVKYVTNPPNLHDYQGGFELGGYNVEHGHSAASGKGYVNLPMIDDKLALRLTAFGEGIAGWIDNPLMNRTAVNRGEKEGFRASLLFKPTDDLSIRLTASQQDTKVDGPNQVEAVGAGFYPKTTPANQLDLNTAYVDNTYAAQTEKSVIGYYYADINYDLPFASLNSVTSHGTVKASFITDASFINAAAGLNYQAYLSGALKTPLALLQRQYESMSKTSEEVRLTSNPGQKLFGHDFDWIIGGFFNHEDVNFNQAFDFTNIPTPSVPQVTLNSLPPAGAEGEPSKFDEQAVFGQVDFHITSDLDIAAGARFSSDKESLSANFHGSVLVPPGAPPVGPINGNSSSTTWSVAPRWHLDQDTLLYARIATGFRPGGPNLAIPFQPATYPQAYGPDRTLNYEAGVKSYFLDKKVDVDVAAFHIDWSHIQILSTVQTSTGPFTVTGNAGQATSQGFEWNLGWTPLPGLRLGEIGSYSAATLSGDAPVLGGKSGQQLPYVPKWSNTVNADYQWNITGDFQGFVGGSWIFTGQRYTGFASPTSVNEGHVPLPSFSQLNMQGGFHTANYTVELYAHNVMDTRGISVFSNAGGYNETGHEILIQPRTVGIRLAATY